MHVNFLVRRGVRKIAEVKKQEAIVSNRGGGKYVLFIQRG